MKNTYQKKLNTLNAYRKHKIWKQHYQNKTKKQVSENKPITMLEFIKSFHRPVKWETRMIFIGLAIIIWLLTVIAYRL